MSETRTGYRRNIKIVKMILIVSLLGLILCGAYIFHYYYNQNAVAEFYEQLKLKRQAASPTEASPIDFAQFQEINPDIYAWITIPDTSVDYPVVQRADDDRYYLNHAVDGSKGYPGSIYTEDANKKDFSDFDTVIYGHNMKDDSMFGILYRYKEEEFFSTHRELIIYTQTKVLHYNIFAVCDADNRHILNTNDFSAAAGRKAYLRTLRQYDFYNCNLGTLNNLTEKDRIVTLSTCTDRNKTRLLVLAVLKEENRADNLVA